MYEYVSVYLDYQSVHVFYSYLVTSCRQVYVLYILTFLDDEFTKTKEVINL